MRKLAYIRYHHTADRFPNCNYLTYLMNTGGFRIYLTFMNLLM